MGLLVGTRSVFLGISAFLVFVSVVLLTCALSTNVWYYFLAPSPANEPRSILTGPQESVNITFYQETYGMWTSCVYSPNWRYFTCGLIDWKCNFPNCWTIDGVMGCVKTSVDVLGSCAAFNWTRVLLCLSLVLYLLGAVMIFSALCSTNIALPLVGGILGLVGGFLNMIGFCIHLTKLHAGPTKSGFPLNAYYDMGWGQILAIAAWPIAMVASTLGIFAYIGSKQAENDEWEDNYEYDYGEGKPVSEGSDGDAGEDEPLGPQDDRVMDESAGSSAGPGESAVAAGSGDAGGHADSGSE